MIFYCKGCKCYHWINTDIKNDKPLWQFNGDYDKPTISPSIMVKVGHHPDPPDVCHSFIREGKIQYLNDCTHEFAGQTIDLEDEEDD